MRDFLFLVAVGVLLLMLAVCYKIMVKQDELLHKTGYIYDIYHRLETTNSIDIYR